MTEHLYRSERDRKAHFWQRIGLSVKEGIRMHQISGHMTKDPQTHKRDWGNVTEHCLVETVRAEVLGKWIGLPDTVIAEIKVGAALHDYHKKDDITATREAVQAGESPLVSVRQAQKKGEDLLIAHGFASAVIRLAGSAGGDTPQLVEVQKILNQMTLSDDDWAYLIVHYVDDCSIGSDWVKPSEVAEDGRRINIIEHRAQGLRANPTYSKISQEITEELSRHPEFEGMDNINSWFTISHGIERRLAERIKEQTDESIDPYLLPELVDQKIREDIIGSTASKLSTT